MRSTAHSHRSLPYRPAIDGLRALAVLSVICFHLTPALLPGGWFGVDVFFVISGFLITALLLAEYRSRRGRIDLLGFWMARARRLLPALFLVLAAILVATPFLTPRGRIAHVGGDLLATLAYVANWRFVLGDEAYFSQIASPSPLRHAWSLAVEEQFYIVYPLLLISLLALVRRRLTLAGLLGAAAVGSMTLMAVLHQPGLDPSRVYYGTDTRAHQLLIGAAVAMLISGGPGAIAREHIRMVDLWCRRLALPALLVVLSVFWWAGTARSALFEGWLLPLSALITVVLVAATSPSVSWAQRILAWEPLRLVGVVSYGLYLWHWPIAVYLNDQTLPVPDAVRVFIQVTLTAALSFLSYRFVERPVRRHGVRALIPPLPRCSRVISWATVPALIVGALVMPNAARALAPVTEDDRDPGITVSQSTYRPSPRMTSVTFIGNSVPQSLIRHFPSSQYPDLRLNGLTNPGCDSLDVPRHSDGAVLTEAEGCPDWRDSWQRELTGDQPDVVLYFVGQTMVSDRVVDDEVVEFGSKRWVSLIERGLEEARAASGDAKFAVVNLSCHDMPTFNSEEIERVNDTEYVNELNSTVESWAEQENVPFIDQYSFLCASDEYHDTIGGVPLYEDSIHFTAESGAIFWRWLAPRIQRIARGLEPSS